MAKDLIGIIGGSGLGDEMEKHITGGKFRDIDTPFGKSSGPILLGKIGKREIAFINRHGKGHIFSPCKVPYAANIFAFKKLGVNTIISSGAVGSLQEKIAPGHLVIVDQFIDKTFKRQNTFFADFGAVHCELAHPLCDRLRKQLSLASRKIKVKTHSSGTYVCMEGPQFSTRAESLMHRKWGADLIGMTAMPEAKLAREAQICYSLIALASDYDCWRPHEAKKDKQTLLKEILSNLTMATNNCIELIKAVLDSDTPLCSESCQCRKSLELAVWTSPSEIDPAMRKKLQVLFE
jgi:5'-methylthioadenosine phosphorylase